jgi:PKD repeat protein
MERSEVMSNIRKNTLAALLIVVVSSTFPLLQQADAADIGKIDDFPIFQACLIGDDCWAPVVTVPSSPYTVEATSSSGADANFPVSANDETDGNITPTCNPPAGPFPLGTTPVTCTATDAHGNTGTGSFDVLVQDTTKPVVTATSLTMEATSSSGAKVNSYEVSATDIVDGNLTPTCNPPPGLFALKTTSVTCTATDNAGNTADPVSFDVLVQDTTKPVINAKSALKVEATSSSGAQVSYSISAIDIVDGNITPTCIPPPGPFPLGATEVTCTAVDKAGNSASKEFTFTVDDTEPPSINVPSQPLQFKATGESGFIATYEVSAEDIVAGSITPKCSPETGTAFQIGDTLVKCTAEDDAGNEATKSFVVVVSPPDNSLPLAILTSPSGQSEAGKELSFSADKSTDQGGSVVDYSWDFGDGAKGNGVSATHTYQNPGTYTVTLEVTDDKNGKGSDVEEITIVGPTTSQPESTSTPPETPTTAQPETADAVETPAITQPPASNSGSTDNMMMYGIIGVAATAAAVGGIVTVKKIQKKKEDVNIP